MKKLKTSELTGAALDWAVAKCWYTDRRIETGVVGHAAFGVERSPGSGDRYTGWMLFQPSTDWSQGGPIIEREGMTLGIYDHMTLEWSAEVFRHDKPQRTQYLRCGPTPLVAAMRCYVASKLGDEVEVPDEI